jgi:hypothetical protein
MGATSNYFGLALKGRFAMSNTQPPYLFSPARASKPLAIPFAVNDVSSLAKSLRTALQTTTLAPTQVQMLNWLAKAAGYQNFQSLRARVGTPATVPIVAVTAKTGASKRTIRSADAALSTHAAKALMQFDDDGKLTRWPHKFAVQRVAMWGLWMRFDSKRRYSEKEVNSLLNAWHLYGDHATLRRELVNMKLLARKPDCSEYWKVAQKPSDDIQVFLRALRLLQ